MWYHFYLECMTILKWFQSFLIPSFLIYKVVAVNVFSLLAQELKPVMIHQCHWEKAMATHSSTLAWRISWMEEPGRLQYMGSLGVGHNWATSLSLSTFMHRRRKWQPTPVFLPGESQGRGSLVGCHIWGCRVGHKWSDLAAAAASWLRQKISN